MSRLEGDFMPNCDMIRMEVQVKSEISDGEEEDEHVSEEQKRVWTPDVEGVLLELMEKYPPCGRRKILYEGKMYGRNELIAKLIYQRTGKHRTRKQISSHLQVQHRKITRRMKRLMKNGGMIPQNQAPKHHNHAQTPNFEIARPIPLSPISPGMATAPTPAMIIPALFTDDVQEFISSTKLKFIHFQAYYNHPNGQKSYLLDIRKHSNYVVQPISITSIAHKFPPILMELFTLGPPDAFYVCRCWASLDGFPRDWDVKNFQCDTKFESTYKMAISMRTVVSSFGLPAIDKYETTTLIEEYHEPNSSKYRYEMAEIPMSMYTALLASRMLTIFETQGTDVVNKVLENFSILYITKNIHTNENLLVLAFMIECCEANQMPGCQFYKLVK